jgi:hypothetical protein
MSKEEKDVVVGKIEDGPTPKEGDQVTVFFCGPSRGQCKCECATGGPCDHVWDGPEVPFGDRGSSSTCSKCGMTAIDHDLWVCP